MRALLAMALLATPGCLLPATEVHFRDPAQVTLVADTPSGASVILPPGRDPIEAELPRSEPPYLGTALFEAHPMRNPGGGITLRCDACVGHPLEKILRDDGTIAYAGQVADRIAWNDRELRVTFDHPYCGPGRYCGGQYAYRVVFVTPTSNVVEVRHKEMGDTFGGLFPWMLLVDAATAGCFVATGYGFSSPPSDGGPRALGVVGLSLGTILALVAVPLTIATFVALGNPPSDMVVYPR